MSSRISPYTSRGFYIQPKCEREKEREPPFYAFPFYLSHEHFPQIHQAHSNPSKIAEHIAQGGPQSKSVIIDAFAGAGGNAIAFARCGKWSHVFAIEKNPDVLKCAKHNAEVYGVGSKIIWIEGDGFAVLKKRLKSIVKDAIIFASPPWGGKFTGSFAPTALQPPRADNLAVYCRTMRDSD